LNLRNSSTESRARSVKKEEDEEEKGQAAPNQEVGQHVRVKVIDDRPINETYKMRAFSPLTIGKFQFVLTFITCRYVGGSTIRKKMAGI